MRSEAVGHPELQVPQSVRQAVPQAVRHAIDPALSQPVDLANSVDETCPGAVHHARLSDAVHFA
jgi:xanthine dehydrogenase molybdopterin-binding subunit B